MVLCVQGGIKNYALLTVKQVRKISFILKTLLEWVSLTALKEVLPQKTLRRKYRSYIKKDS